LDGCAKKTKFFPSTEPEKIKDNFSVIRKKFLTKGSSAELQMGAILGITYTVIVITQKLT